MASVTYSGVAVGVTGERGSEGTADWSICMSLLQHGNSRVMWLLTWWLRTPRVSKQEVEGRLGGSVREASNFSSGQDLMAPGFKPCIGLCVDSSEPGACFRLCISLSTLPRSRSLSFKNKLKKKTNQREVGDALPSKSEMGNWHSIASAIFHWSKKTASLLDSRERTQTPPLKGKSVQEYVAIFNLPHNHIQKDIRFLG